MINLVFSEKKLSFFRKLSFLIQIGQLKEKNEKTD